MIAGIGAVAALAASGSFLASCALVVQSLVAASWWKRARPWLALAVLVVWIGPTVARLASERIAPVQGSALSEPAPRRQPTHLERAQRIVSRDDSSWRSRAVYAKAGWEGFAERPLLGWGPGSVPWTATRFTKPVPLLNPPSEIVGDLHSWPVQLGYETGMTGLILCAALVLLFTQRRLGELRRPRALGVRDAPLHQALLGV